MEFVGLWEYVGGRLEGMEYEMKMIMEGIEGFVVMVEMVGRLVFDERGRVERGKWVRSCYRLRREVIIFVYKGR